MTTYEKTCEKCGSTVDVKVVQYTSGSQKGQRVNLCAKHRTNKKE